MKKPYVQFSKRIVVAVTAAVTVICAAGMALCAVLGDTSGIISAVQAYIGYATIAFAAYSGNSAVEKWLMSKYRVGTTDSEDDTDDTLVG